MTEKTAGAFPRTSRTAWWCPRTGRSRLRNIQGSRSAMRPSPAADPLQEAAQVAVCNRPLLSLDHSKQLSGLTGEPGIGALKVDDFRQRLAQLQPMFLLCHTALQLRHWRSGTPLGRRPSLSCLLCSSKLTRVLHIHLRAPARRARCLRGGPSTSSAAP